MYLIDKEIKAKLGELSFECENDKHSLDLNQQIQPCSVDLRLDAVFWKPKRNIKSIDLRKSKLLDLSPRHYYQEIALKEGEHIVIKPGEFILGRVYEKFTMPNKCSGKLEGRSSLSRLGLGVNFSDFINPGWRGHMPLQLVNFSKTPIKIFPYIPVCQLMLIPLSDKPDRIYGEQELQSKYMEDDGGPSYWWRDKRIKSLQEIFQQKDIALNIQENILTALGVKDPDIIHRFEKYAANLNRDDISNTEWVLQKFMKNEKMKQRFEEVFIRGSQVVFILLTGNTWRILAAGGAMTIGKIIFITLNIFLLGLFLYSFFYEKKKYFISMELEQPK